MENAQSIKTLFEFQCDGYRFALPLSCVRRVVHSAQPMPLPGAPDIVQGILNVGGDPVVLVDFRRRAGLPAVALEPFHPMLLVDIRDYCLGLAVDAVDGVIDGDASILGAVPDRLAHRELVEGVIRLEDGLCLICDPEKFLFGEEKRLLRQALEQGNHGG